MKDKIGLWIIIIAVAFITILGAINHISNKSTTTTSNLSNNNPEVEYEALHQTIETDIVKMTLLVTPKTTKTQALSLGEYLRNKFKDRSFVYIAIFDEKWAAENRMNMDVPSERITNHYLVQVTINKNSGMDAVQWMKE